MRLLRSNRIGTCRRARFVAVLLVTASLSVLTLAGTAAPAATPTDDPLAPHPLAQMTKVDLAVNAKIDAFTPAFVAQALGEFTKENLQVTISILPAASGLQLVASGGVDAFYASYTAGLFNAVAAGAQVAAVMPSYKGLGKGSKAGVWVKKSLVKGAPGSLKGKKIASSVGISSRAFLGVQRYLATAKPKLSFTDIEIVTIPTDSLVAALQNGGVDGAIIQSPQYLPLLKDKRVKFLLPTSTPDVPEAALLFGPNLLKANRVVGTALVRALMRTSRDHLQGNYKADSKVGPALATGLGLDLSTVRQTPSLEFDPNMAMPTSFPEGVLAIQQMWVGAGGILQYTSPLLKADQIHDFGFQEAVLRGRTR
jgi:NitT/TauT family transport system substrate-binding protein